MTCAELNWALLAPALLIPRHALRAAEIPLPVANARACTLRQRLRSVQSLERTVTTAPQRLVSARRSHIDLNLRTSSKAAEKGHLLTEEGALHGTEEDGVVQIAPAMIALILRRVAALGAQIKAKDDEVRKAEKAAKPTAKPTAKEAKKLARMKADYEVAAGKPWTAPETETPRSPAATTSGVDPQYDSGDAEAKAPPGAKRDEKELREDLEKCSHSIRRKRAKKAGATEREIEDADEEDAEDHLDHPVRSDGKKYEIAEDAEEGAMTLTIKPQGPPPGGAPSEGFLPSGAEHGYMAGVDPFSLGIEVVAQGEEGELLDGIPEDTRIVGVSAVWGGRKGTVHKKPEAKKEKSGKIRPVTAEDAQVEVEIEWDEVLVGNIARQDAVADTLKKEFKRFGTVEKVVFQTHDPPKVLGKASSKRATAAGGNAELAAPSKHQEWMSERGVEATWAKLTFTCSAADEVRPKSCSRNGKSRNVQPQARCAAHTEALRVWQEILGKATRLTGKHLGFKGAAEAWTISQLPADDQTAKHTLDDLDEAVGLRVTLSRKLRSGVSRGSVLVSVGKPATEHLLWPFACILEPWDESTKSGNKKRVEKERAKSIENIIKDMRACDGPAEKEKGIVGAGISSKPPIQGEPSFAATIAAALKQQNITDFDSVAGLPPLDWKGHDADADDERKSEAKLKTKSEDESAGGEAQKLVAKTHLSSGKMYYYNEETADSFHRDPRTGSFELPRGAVLKKRSKGTFDELVKDALHKIKGVKLSTAAQLVAEATTDDGDTCRDCAAGMDWRTLEGVDLSIPANQYPRVGGSQEDKTPAEIREEAKNQIWISNIAHEHANKEMLRERFAQFGTIEEDQVYIRPVKEGKRTTWALIAFEKPEEVEDLFQNKHKLTEPATTWTIRHSLVPLISAVALGGAAHREAAIALSEQLGSDSVRVQTRALNVLLKLLSCDRCTAKNFAAAVRQHAGAKLEELSVDSQMTETIRENAKACLHLMLHAPAGTISAEAEREDRHRDILLSYVQEMQRLQQTFFEFVQEMCVKFDRSGFRLQLVERSPNSEHRVVLLLRLPEDTFWDEYRKLVIRRWKETGEGLKFSKNPDAEAGQTKLKPELNPTEADRIQVMALLLQTEESHGGCGLPTLEHMEDHPNYDPRVVAVFPLQNSEWVGKVRREWVKKFSWSKRLTQIFGRVTECTEKSKEQRDRLKNANLRDLPGGATRGMKNLASSAQETAKEAAAEATEMGKRGLSRAASAAKSAAKQTGEGIVDLSASAAERVQGALNDEYDEEQSVRHKQPSAYPELTIARCSQCSILE